jgi:hypothetical protein
MEQCDVFGNLWLTKTAVCCFGDNAVSKLVQPDVAWPYPYPPVKWLGLGCPTPCAVEAAARGVNAQVLCHKLQQPVRYDDGGCLLMGLCTQIHCMEVCQKAGVLCAWGTLLLLF